MRLGCLVRADLLMWFTSSGVAVPQEISIAPRGRNQKQVSATEWTKDGRRNEREARGKRNTIVLGGD